MVQITGTSDGPNIDGGQYKLKIGASEIRTITDSRTEQEKDCVQITFTIIGDEDWDGTEFNDLFSLMTGKKSKLGQLARAAFKTDDLPEEWDTEDLQGLYVIATIKLKDTGFNSLVVDTIKPMKGKAAAKLAKVEEEDDPFAEDEEVA